MPRQTLTSNAQIPTELVREVIRLCRAWEDAPDCARLPAASRWQAPVIVIDGQSGSGKSTLAAELMTSLRMAGVRGVQLAGPDVWFPGWYGLREGSMITARLLTGTPVLRAHQPVAASLVGARGTFHWNWGEGAWGRFCRLDPTRPLIIEGSGALTPVCAAVASLRVWVEACGGSLERQNRALARDGDMYEPWWDVWAEQERRHLVEHNPRSLADYVVVTGGGR